MVDDAARARARAMRHAVRRRVDDPEALLTREWLVTNGLGGYASGTIAGVTDAALPRPARRRAARPRSAAR